MYGQFYTFEGLKMLGQNATTPQGLTSFTAVATAGSANISQVSSTAALSPGQLVASTLFPAGTFIVSVNNASGTVTLSQPATGSTPGGQTTYFVAGGVYTQNLPLTIHLLQGAIPVSPTLLFSQLTEANYDGYLPQQAVGPVVFNTPPPRQYTAWQYERQTYQPTDYVVGNNITGHAWTWTPPGASTPSVLAVEVYQSSVPLMQDGDVLTFNPVLSFPFDVSAGIASPGVP